MAQGELTDAEVFGDAPPPAPAPQAQPPQAPPDAAIPAAPAGTPAGSQPVEVTIEKGVSPNAREVDEDAAHAPAPELSDADVFGTSSSAEASPAPSGTKPDFGLGFQKGFGTVAGNFESGLDWAAHKVPILGDALDGGLKALTGTTIPEAVQQFHEGLAKAQAQGQVPGFLGELAGNGLGTLPTLALPGGPLVQGAAGGALSTEGQDIPTILRDAAVGGILGKVGHVVLGGLLDTLAPKVNEAGQTLLNAGLRDHLSPGQIFGKHSPQGMLEAAGQAVPIVGEMLRKQGNDALIAANRAVADRVAGGFGGQAQGETAEDLARSVAGAKDAAYDIRTPNGTQLDPIYANTVGGIRQQVQQIPGTTGIPDRFDRLVQQEIAARADPHTGILSDDAVKSAKNAISTEISDWAGDSNGWSRDYVRQLRGLRRALTSNLGRSSPAAQAQLASADANYPSYKILENAFRRGTQNSTNETGWFTPQQLQSAITSKSDPAQVAAGTAPLQDLAKAMKENLPRKFKDVASVWHAVPEALVASGVAGSDILGGHGGALTAGMLAGLPLASKVGQRAAREALLRSAAARAVAESKIGPLDRLLAAPAALGGGALAPTLLPQAVPTQ